MWPTLDNLDRLPIILSMTCLDGYWIYPRHCPRLDGDHAARRQRWISGVLLADGAGRFHRSRSTGARPAERRVSTGGTRLGAAALAGKVALYASGQNYDLIDTFTVFGDPALRLPIGPGHDVYLPLVRRETNALPTRLEYNEK